LEYAVFDAALRLDSIREKLRAVKSRNVKHHPSSRFFVPDLSKPLLRFLSDN
jgi:hypothetical protein